MDFQTRYLRYFLAVADHLSFSRAAEHLGLSQPALSQRIQALERQLGFTLFVRTSRSVELTHMGDALVEPARGLVGYASRIDRVIRDMRVDRPCPLLIGSAMYSDFPERTALLAAFTEEYPDDLIDTETGYTLALFQALEEGTIDVAVIVGPLPESQFDYLVMRWFPFELIVPAASDLASQDEIAPETLRGRHLGVFRQKSYPQLYNRTMQPLESLGMRVTSPPDQSPAGMLAYAALHGMIVPMPFTLHTQEELQSAGMVSRPVRDFDPVAAIMLVRHKGTAATISDKLWNFTRRRLEKTRPPTFR